MLMSPGNITKEEIFRLYEQSELSDIINDEKGNHKHKKKSGAFPNRIPFLYTILSAGTVAGAISFMTLIKRYKLF